MVVFERKVGDEFTLHAQAEGKIRIIVVRAANDKVRLAISAPGGVHVQPTKKEEGG